MKAVWLIVLGLAGGALASLRADDLPIIAKARSYLGTEAALDAVNSVHLEGRIVILDADRTATPVSFDQIFQKPDQQSLTAVFPDKFFRQVLDGYDGWRRVQTHKSGEPLLFDDRRSALTILGADEIRSLRADVWEFLNFYRGIERAGGAIADLGPATIDGIACEKVALTHPGGVVFDRYFDPATGRLVYTESNTGSRIREHGEIVAGGIRFPQTIVSIQRTASGKDQTLTMTVDKVTLNETYPDDYFGMPIAPVGTPSAPAAAGSASLRP
jgi:hypothetical protein